VRVDAGTADRAAIPQSALFGDLTAGAVCGLTIIVFAASYAALIFAGPLAAGQPAGFVAMFMSCLVTGLGAAVWSSLRFASASPDGNSTVVLAAIAMQIQHTMGPAASAEALGATVVTMLMLAAIGVGGVIAVLGLLRAGRIVRFIPYQVTAGFLGATGWSLTLGGMAVGVGMPLDWAAFAAADVQLKLAAAMLVGVALLVVVPRLRSPLAVPGVLAIAVALHHVIAAWLGVSVAAQTQSGWLLNAPAHLSVNIPWSPETLRLVDWTALEAAAPGLLAVLLVAVVSLLLGVNAIEVAAGTDADIDRELRVGGLSSVASGLLGGTLGYISLSRSLLLLRTGAKTRLAPCVAALVVGLLPILMPGALGLAPRPVLGGLLIFLGLQLLDEWVVRSRRSLSTAEWLTVLLVVAVTSRFGFVVGVFTGVALGCANFAVSCSRAAPTRARYRGDVAASHVSRPAADRALLHADGAGLLVLHLQGFLFFGTANRLLEDVRAEIAAMPGRMRFLILDFQNVDGIDGSALSSFGRIQLLAAAEGIALVLTAVPPGVAKRLRTLRPATGAQLRRFETLDQGLEWSEEARLADLQRGVTVAPTIEDELGAMFGHPGVAARFIGRLDPRMVPEGTVLIQQHDRSDELMFVESGRVSINLQLPDGSEYRVRTMGMGAMIGEIGFLLGEPRTATVRADTACRVLCLTRAMLGRIERDDPDLGFAFHRAMAQLLAHRLIDKDGMIAALMRTGR
jgi:SulP family sulfate permease